MQPSGGPQCLACLITRGWGIWADELVRFASLWPSPVLSAYLIISTAQVVVP